MTQRAFKQVDVFTPTPYFGNPLAVVLDGTGLSDDAMQRFAQWTNLSETTFVLPPVDPSADYRVRIFTPGGELPFAGQPTLGTCHSWLQAGGQAKHPDVIIQECKVGLIRIRREHEGRLLAFAAPPLERSAPSTVLLAKVAAALGLKAPQILAAQMLDNGPVWLGLLLDSQQTVLQLEPDHAALKGLVPGVGVASVNAAPLAQTPHQLIARSNREARAFGNTQAKSLLGDDAASAVEVRFFAADIGVAEDPVTGSFNASLAQWLIADGLAPAHYLASQGTCIGRAGQVHISRDADGQVWVGGETVTCIDGAVSL